jgi:hypothetical protein
MRDFTDEPAGWFPDDPDARARCAHLGSRIATRRHDRQAVGGPLGLVLLFGIVLWFTATSGLWVWAAVAGLLLVGAAAALGLEIRRWDERLTLFDHGLVHSGRGRAILLLLDDIDTMEFTAGKSVGVAELLLHFPLGLIMAAMSSGWFRLRVYPAAGGRRIALAGSFKRKGDEINTIADRLQRKLAARIASGLQAGQAVPWTRRLTLMPDGLALLKSPVRGDRPAEIARFIAYGEMTHVKLRGTKVRVKTAGRRRPALKYRAETRGLLPGWLVLTDIVAGRYPEIHAAAVSRPRSPSMEPDRQ